MTLNPVSLIEKAINEHGSSEILKECLAFASDQFVALDRKASELEREIGKLEAKLEREQLDRDKAQQELKRLQKEYEEETILHSFIEFRRGKRTQNKWIPCCQKCHLQTAVIAGTGRWQVYCDSCKFLANLEPGVTLGSIVSQLPL
jgi:hypothetical protein